MKPLCLFFASLLLLSHAAAQDRSRFPDFDAPPRPGWGLAPDVHPAQATAAPRAFRQRQIQVPQTFRRGFPNFDVAPLPGLGLHPDNDLTLIALNNPLPRQGGNGNAGANGQVNNGLPNGENDFRWAKLFLDPMEYPRLLGNLDPYVMEEEAAWRALAFSRRSAAAGHPEGTLYYGFLLLERGEHAAALKQFEHTERLGRKVPARFLELARQGLTAPGQRQPRRSPWLFGSEVGHQKPVR